LTGKENTQPAEFITIWENSIALGVVQADLKTKRKICELLDNREKLLTK
jgi:hypothetical protein